MTWRTAGPAARCIAALGALAWSAHRARIGEVSPREERLFRAVNAAPNDPALAVWTIMQSGSFAAVPVVAVLTAAHRGPRRGGLVAAAGTTAWLTSKLSKLLVERGRPADLLSDVVIRGTPQSGLGYPSGHAAVALTLALSASGPGTPRALAVGIAGVAAAGRIYTGAHLPLDVVGGLGLGAVIGGTAMCEGLASDRRRGRGGGVSTV